MVRKRLYAKQTASVEYEQIDLFSLLEEEQRQVDRTAEQVRGYEITVGHAAVQRLRARGADDETIAAVAAEYRENRLRGLGRRDARIAAENKLGVGAATPGETTPQPVVKRFTQSSGTENNTEERNNDGRDDMDRPAAQGALREDLKAMEQRRAAHPELFNKWALPYKVFTRSSLHGIQNMRINWLMDNHPQRFREMMMANVLEEHLRDIERRTRERQAQIMDQLMESRHLLNRTDCLKAAPQMTDLDRLNGMNEAQAESMSMAIHEIVESF